MKQSTLKSIFLVMSFFSIPGFSADVQVLKFENFRHYIESFNINDTETNIQAISNENAWEFLKQNIPFFECPDKKIEETYYYRWWSFRKHLEKTPDGYVFTEFIMPVKHAGAYNTISCALEHHIYEGRWLKNQEYLDEYIQFWFRKNEGQPQPHFHKFSSWVADALYHRYLVNQNQRFLLDLLPDLIRDYQQWECEKQLPDGMFYQFDVRDGMEESISGSRKAKNRRPTINSYMYGNALAIAQIAGIAGENKIAEQFLAKAKKIQTLVLENLWDSEAQFFKVRLENGNFSDAREAIGFIPWYFNLPDSGYEAAWKQILDEKGFKAPFGLTTAERRHPAFRSHGTGTCEWDGAIWPFASTQTLVAMANLIRNYPQSVISKNDYFDALKTYATAHQKNGKPYVGEYQDESTGEWLKGDNPRSQHYNHSAFCDLVISGLVGLIPRSDNQLEINPLLPPGKWEWFALEGISYHGKKITIIWDAKGTKYNMGQGLFVLVNNKVYAHSKIIEKIKCTF